MPALLDGRWPQGRPAAHAGRPPAQPVHAPGLEPSPPRGRARHAPVPARAVRRARRRAASSRGCGRSSPTRAIVSLHLLLPRDLREGLPSISDRWQGFGGRRRPGRRRRRRPPRRRRAAGGRGRLRRALRGLRARPRSPPSSASWTGIRPQAPGDRPPLHFLHAMFPHSPWQYLPSGRQFSDATARLGQDLAAGRADPLRAAHALPAPPAAGRLHRPPPRAPARAAARRAALRPLARRRRRRPRHQLPRRAALARRRRGPPAPDVVPVPLFVKAPGQRSGRVVDTQVRTIDVLPTIADLLGRAACRGGSTGGSAPAGDAATARSSLRGAGAGRLAARHRRGCAPAARPRCAGSSRSFGHGARPPGDLRPRAPPRAHRPARSPACRCGRSAQRAPTSTRPRSWPGSTSATGFVPAHITGDLTGRPAGRRSTSPWRSTGGSPPSAGRWPAGAAGSRSWSPSPRCARGQPRAGARRSRRRARGTFTLLGQTGVRAASPSRWPATRIRAGGRPAHRDRHAHPRRRRARAAGRPGPAPDGVGLRRARPPPGRARPGLRRATASSTTPRPRDLRPAIAAALGTGPATWAGARTCRWARAAGGAGGRLRVYGVAGRSAGAAALRLRGRPAAGAGLPPACASPAARSARPAPPRSAIARRGRARAPSTGPSLRGAALLVRGWARRRRTAARSTASSPSPAAACSSPGRRRRRASRSTSPAACCTEPAAGRGCSPWPAAWPCSSRARDLQPGDASCASALSSVRIDAAPSSPSLVQRRRV